MQTFHIHIQGIVQGVGFRPFVYKMALQHRLKGWVNNTNDGVHIEITNTQAKADFFLDQLLTHLPPLAVVTQYHMQKVDFKEFTSFDIVESNDAAKPRLLLTPDVALCEDCRKELYEEKNKRFQYPFITCTNCGPRYSIIRKLPYDRPHTTMDPFVMCPDCLTEYHNPLERRHFSQTNSCPDCAIEIQLYTSKIPNTNSDQTTNKLQPANTKLPINPNSQFPNIYESDTIIKKFTDLSQIVKEWENGKIIAIKGIGGYLLTCDATNTEAIETLRKRKHRPKKPFALMYPSLAVLQQDAFVNQQEIKELQSISSPIVLLDVKTPNPVQLALGSINKGLFKIGVMLPYTPLLDLLLRQFQKPIVATSANISNSTIIFDDQKAVGELLSIADIILMNNREILIPQDDGVVQFSPKHGQKIVLRRSRGKAPVYINGNLNVPDTSVLATGAMLKSVFGFLYQKNFYISQYLGNTESYDAQLNYKQTFNHLQSIFDIKYDQVVTDLHPDYFATRFGKELAEKQQTKTLSLQHHKAHFWSVLGEHNLMNADKPILGVIWDGTGLGEDGNIWGGEFFTYQKGTIERITHVDEFPFILGDKMPKEPRISAFVLLHDVPEAEVFIKPKFTETEWNVYQKLVTQTSLKCTSMGRIFDAVSSLLFGYNVHSFEAEASMQLENEANKFQKTIHKKQINNNTKILNSEIKHSHFSYLKDKNLPENFVNSILQNILSDLQQNTDKQCIAYKFHCTLVDYIDLMAQKYNLKNIAFSGGVFQNALLVDLIIENLSPRYQLYFHNEFSPNDEGIAFGQLMFALNHR